PVIPYSERKSISKERTFAQDTVDIYQLKTMLTRMTEQLAFQLRKEHKLTACVAVKVRYANFDTVSKQIRIPYSANDAFLLEKVLSLFQQVYDRRVRLRLIGVKFSHLVPGGTQIQLFEDQSRQVDLYEALDALKHKYGDKVVGRGSGI
ncbi:MAG: DNA polymerase IV, partial [Bacteroidota bacterium]